MTFGQFPLVVRGLAEQPDGRCPPLGSEGGWLERVAEHVTEGVGHRGAGCFAVRVAVSRPCRRQDVPRYVVTGVVAGLLAWPDRFADRAVRVGAGGGRAVGALGSRVGGRLP